MGNKQHEEILNLLERLANEVSSDEILKDNIVTQINKEKEK